MNCFGAGAAGAVFWSAPKPATEVRRRTRRRRRCMMRYRVADTGNRRERRFEMGGSESFSFFLIFLFRQGARSEWAENENDYDYEERRTRSEEKEERERG